MKSTDDGLTWTEVHATGPATESAAIGPGNEVCFFTNAPGNGNPIHAECSRDAGVKWTAEPTPLQGGHGSAHAAFDEAGNLFVGAVTADGAAVAWRDPWGTWRGPMVPFPGASRGSLAIAAGLSGAVALVWFETDDDSQWFLHAAVTADIKAPEPVWEKFQVDSVPSRSNPIDGYGVSDLGPRAALGPDGALNIAYAKILELGTAPQLYYVRSAPTGLGMANYWWGPTQ